MVCELDWEAVDASVLDEVEADTYYCISRLLTASRTTTRRISRESSGW